MTVDSMIRLGVPTVLDANKNTVPDPEVLFF